MGVSTGDGERGEVGVLEGTGDVERLSMEVWGGGGDGEQGGVEVWSCTLEVDGIGDEGVGCELG